MKLWTLFIAAALATKQQDDSQGADDSQQSSEQDNSQGAGDSQGSTQASDYGGQSAYPYAEQNAPYAEPQGYTSLAAPAAPTCCVSMCPSHAPFFNPATCSCVPGYVEQDVPMYQNWGAQQSYGAPVQQQGYRKLQQQSFGDQVAAPAFTSGPAGTLDTRSLRINRTGTIVLWVAFAILFLLACYYLRMFNYYVAVADATDALDGFIFPDNVSNSILHWLANPSLIAGCVCLIASLAYLTMASGNGWYTRCHDGRQFFFARYIDWVVTTPLMLHALAHFANSPDEIWNFLFFSDVIMIVSGLVASTIDGPEKWIYYGFAVLAFIPVLYYICKLREQLLDNRRWDTKTGLLIDVDDVTGLPLPGQEYAYLPYVWFFHNYKVMADLTVLAWFLYPIVWIFAEGTNKLSVTGEAITYTVLDIVSKGIFGWFIVHSQFGNPDDFNHPLLIKNRGFH